MSSQWTWPQYLGTVLSVSGESLREQMVGRVENGDLLCVCVCVCVCDDDDDDDDDDETDVNAIELFEQTDACVMLF